MGQEGWLARPLSAWGASHLPGLDATHPPPPAPPSQRSASLGLSPHDLPCPPKLCSPQEAPRVSVDEMGWRDGVMGVLV